MGRLAGAKESIMVLRSDTPPGGGDQLPPGSGVTASAGWSSWWDWFGLDVGKFVQWV